MQLYDVNVSKFYLSGSWLQDVDATPGRAKTEPLHVMKTPQSVDSSEWSSSGQCVMSTSNRSVNGTLAAVTPASRLPGYVPKPFMDLNSYSA